MDLDRVIAVRTNKTVFRDGELCVKVFEKSFSKADVLNEALNQARVETTSLSVPKLREVTTIDGKWVIVSDFVAGKTLERLMEENPDRKHELLDKFVSLQVEIQSQSCPLLVGLRDKLKKRIALAKLSDEVKSRLYDSLEQMPKHTKLCHGDFNPSNIIVGNDGKYYIFDWAHATVGNASADAARTYLLFWLEGKISRAEEYLDLYCVKTNTEKKYVKKWLPVVAAAQSVTCRQNEREFLLAWANAKEEDL